MQMPSALMGAKWREHLQPLDHTSGTFLSSGPAEQTCTPLTQSLWSGECDALTGPGCVTPHPCLVSTRARLTPAPSLGTRSVNASLHLG